MGLQGLVPWLIQYKYLIIFPVAVIEGPIITIITGFLASLGYLNFFTALGVLVVGDFTGDSLYFMIGRFGREKFIRKYGRFIGITEARLAKLETHFEKHAFRTFLFGKFAHGLGNMVLAAAGMAKVPYKKLLIVNFPTTILKTFILLVVGFYFGQAYLKLNIYINYIGLSFIIIFFVVYFLFLRNRVVSQIDSEIEAE